MSDDLSPYASDQLDELLSAELDGELDAAARELGVTVDEVTARLRATPGADARRAALAAARELMAVPPEIDELLARRLRAKALRVAVDEHADRELERKRRRRRQVLGVSGIAAAAVAVVALAGGLSAKGGGSDSASKKRASAAAPTTAAAGFAATNGSPKPVALGTFTDKRALATQAITRTTSKEAAADTVLLSPEQRQQLAAGSLSPSTTASPVADAAHNKPVTLPAEGYSVSRTTTRSATKSAAACPTPSPVREGDRLVLRATATLSGKPVIVFVFAGGGEHSVEIENINCSLVDIQMLR